MHARCAPRHPCNTAHLTASPARKALPAKQLEPPRRQPDRCRQLCAQRGTVAACCLAVRPCSQAGIQRLRLLGQQSRLLPRRQAGGGCLPGDEHPHSRAHSLLVDGWVRAPTGGLAEGQQQRGVEVGAGRRSQAANGGQGLQNAKGAHEAGRLHVDTLTASCSSSPRQKPGGHSSPRPPRPLSPHQSPPAPRPPSAHALAGGPAA